MASIELAKRMQKENTKRFVIKEPQDGYEYIKHKLMFEKQEKVILLCLNSRLEIIQEKLLFIGSGDASMLETKEVFQHTLRCGANRIILIHNHPSGNPAPSVEDELITQKIKEMADCLEIEFIDHLIVGNHCFYSFASKKSIKIKKIDFFSELYIMNDTRGDYMNNRRKKEIKELLLVFLSLLF